MSNGVRAPVDGTRTVDLPPEAEATEALLRLQAAACDDALLMDAADEIAALRAAAKMAREALSDLLMTRDPIVYSDALRALDEALGHRGL